MHQLLIRHRWPLIITGIILLIGLRFWLVAISPNGFYIDEAATGAHVQHMLADGTDYHGASWPLMSRSLGGGYTTSVYLYPLTVWSAIFGASEAALRSFSQFVTILAIAAVAYSAYLLRGYQAAILTLITGLLLPWSWVGGNLAWDPAITPLFIALALVFFALLLKNKALSPLQKVLLLAGMTLAFVAAAYSYPPTRVAAPLLLGGALFYLWRQQYISLSLLSVPVIVGAISSLPLAIFITSPEALERSASLHVFNDGLMSGVVAFTHNMTLLLDPDSLFINDTSNLRHTAGRFGALGPLSLIGLAAIVFGYLKEAFNHKARQYHLMLIIAILIGFAASALTTEGQPHYLRAVSSWPFIVLLVGLGWDWLMNNAKARPYMAAVGAVLGLLTVLHMALVYPTTSADAFNSRNHPGQHQDIVDMYYH